MNKFNRKDGIATLYALACGYRNTHRVGDDAEAIVMGQDGATFYVKSRVHVDPQKGREGEKLWLTYDNHADALRMFKMLRKSVGPAQQTKPQYCDSNPKIDLRILCSDGRTLKYTASTNYWATVRDALAFYNAQGIQCYVFGSIDK